MEIIKKGKAAGKTIAIFSGIHGNETVGIKAMDKIVREIEVTAGTVYFVYANTEAIKRNERYREKNLNRLFLRKIGSESAEEIRAVELMKILDNCDALLDIHAFNSDRGTPFIICGKNCLDIAAKMEFEIVSTGWDKVEKGSSDGYMQETGKIGICIECGPVKEWQKYLPLAEKSIYQFLQYFGCIDLRHPYDSIPQEYIEAERSIIKKSNDFRFTENFSDFEMLTKGRIFAYDAADAYVAGDSECIIFPRPETSIGNEACIIGKRLTHKS